MFSNIIKKKRIICLAVIVVCLSLAIVGAASNTVIIGGLFGFSLALGIDALIDSFKKKKVETINTSTIE